MRLPRLAWQAPIHRHPEARQGLRASLPEICRAVWESLPRKMPGRHIRGRGTTNFRATILPLRLLIATIAIWVPLGGAEAGDPASELPSGPGRELIAGHCAVCHSLRLVTQSRMSRERWDATITWMQEKQKLWPLPPDVRRAILDYLATHFSALDIDSFDARAVNPLPENISPIPGA